MGFNFVSNRGPKVRSEISHIFHGLRRKDNLVSHRLFWLEYSQN